MRVLLVNCVAGRFGELARALEQHEALAALWTSEKNRFGIPPEHFARAWPFHLAMKPFYHLTAIGPRERMFHALSPLWRSWVRGQKPPPFDIMHASMGYATEPFDLAEKAGALKVVDAGSSHPTSFYGFWQRECDLWCPGAVPGVPRSLFGRCNRELERADLILCPSLFVKESMLYNGLPESKCVICPFGVDTAVFTSREAVPAKPRFVSVGGICVRKGHPYLFRAFEQVRSKIPSAELVCVGNIFPDMKLEMRRYRGTFTHHQEIPHTELARILRTATALVLPSNEEGFAKAILEAMASGVPVIATHESGATTLVQNGTEGFIVRTRDIGAISDAMLKLATDARLNEQMGKAARAKADAGHSWRDYASRMLDIFASAR